MRVPQNSNVVRDQIIYFPRLAVEGEEPVLFRRVEIWDKEKEEAIVFLSNLLAFGATTIAAIYKDRWEVELFFKGLKQLCKIKTFVGTSANAVKTQVWTALIAMLVLKYLQLKSSFSWSLSTLAALLRQQLFFAARLRRCRRRGRTPPGPGVWRFPPRPGGSVRHTRRRPGPLRRRRPG